MTDRSGSDPLWFARRYGWSVVETGRELAHDALSDRCWESRRIAQRPLKRLRMGDEDDRTGEAFPLARGTTEMPDGRGDRGTLEEPPGRAVHDNHEAFGRRADLGQVTEEADQTQHAFHRAGPDNDDCSRGGERGSAQVVAFFHVE